MSEKEIIEGNKLIAEFMDMEVHSVDEEEGELWVITDLHRNGAFEERTNACFHFSWDWLMPVWKKVIEVIGVFCIPNNNHYKLWIEKADEIKNSIVNEVDVKKAATQIARLIQWYNSNK